MKNKIFDEIELSDEMILSLIGKQCQKISNKPFSTGNKIETIEKIVKKFQFEHGQFNAIIIDNKPVELRRCNVRYQLQPNDLISFFDYEMDKQRVVGIICIEGDKIIVDSNETDGYQTQKLNISEVELFYSIPNIILSI